jgi:hypothetical protein
MTVFNIIVASILVLTAFALVVAILCQKWKCTYFKQYWRVCFILLYIIWSWVMYILQ